MRLSKFLSLTLITMLVLSVGYANPPKIEPPTPLITEGLSADVLIKAELNVAVVAIEVTPQSVKVASDRHLHPPMGFMVNEHHTNASFQSQNFLSSDYRCRLNEGCNNYLFTVADFNPHNKAGLLHSLNYPWKNIQKYWTVAGEFI